MSRIGADQAGRHSKAPELRRPERLDDLRAGVRHRAPIEQAARRAAARPIVVAAPPEHRLAAWLVQRRRAAWQGESKIHRCLPRRNPRERAFPHHAARQILVESQVDERLDEVARLAVADRNRVTDGAGDRIGRAGAVARRLPEKRDDVASSGQTNTEDERIPRRVDELVQLRGIESIPDAQPCRVGRPGKKRRAAIRERPRRPRNDRDSALHSRRRLRGRARERGARLIERGRRIGGRISAHRAQSDADRRRTRRDVGEAREYEAGDRRAVGVSRDGHLDGLVVRRRHHIALPSAHERDVALGACRRSAVAPVDDGVYEHTRRPGHVNRLRQRKRRDVFHAAARISRREVQVLDDCVPAIGGIDFSVNQAADDLELTGRAERLPVRHRLARLDLQADDLRVGRRGHHQQNDERGPRAHPESPCRAAPS